MSASVATMPRLPPPADQDHFVLLRNVDWKSYLMLRDQFDSPGLRMTYLEGTLELMSPSTRHETYKSRIARFLELHALECDVPLECYGSTTFRHELKERGLEPDECYAAGRTLAEGEYPDLAIEVVISSPGLNKLEIYQTMAVREVWYWFAGSFQIYVLGPDGYTLASRSELLPSLDHRQLAALIEEPDQHAALKRYQASLRTR